MATTWRVERLVPGGEGLARAADGQVAFVAGGLPGDELEPEQVEAHRGYLRCTSHRLVSPSPERIQASCPWASECGGCDLMSLARTAQLRVKREIVVDALQRTGRSGSEALAPEVVDGGAPLGYRHRARLHVSRTGEVGFFGRRSRELVAIDRCAVCTDPVNAGLAALRRGAARDLGALTTIELRSAPLGEQLVACGTARRGEERAALAALRRALGDAGVAWIPGFSPGAPPRQRYPLAAGLELSAGPTTFTQVNWPVNLRMIADIVAGARARSARSFVDLYAGAGNFALPLLAAGLAGHAVERSGEAIALAREAARGAGLDPATFQVGSAEDFAARLGTNTDPPELVVVDPPRTGAKALTRALAAAGPRWVALIGCDPVALARDLRSLRDAGFSVTGMTTYDLFPQTHHVETVAWLDGPVRAARASRRGGGRQS